MDRLRSLVDGLLGILRRGRERAELDEEMRFHLRMATEENIRAGMSPREARRRARIQFGAQDWHAERVREERGGVFLEDFLRDVRFGLRGLRKRPVFALTACAVAVFPLGFAWQPRRAGLPRRSSPRCGERRLEAV